MPRTTVSRLIRALLVAATAVSTIPALSLAQSHPLVGSWNLELVAGQRVENGSVTPILATATLVVVAAGDSLIGTLTVAPIEGAPQRPPARLAGKRVDGTMTFVSRTEGTMQMNGESRTIEAISTWTLSVTGDTVEGTVAREIIGVSMPAIEPQPVKGRRAP